MTLTTNTDERTVNNNEAKLVSVFGKAKQSFEGRFIYRYYI